MMKSVKINGTKLAELRCARHYSQNEVAVAIGVQRETIARYEAQKEVGVLPRVFRKLVEFFGVPEDQLLIPPKNVYRLAVSGKLPQPRRFPQRQR